MQPVQNIPRPMKTSPRKRLGTWLLIPLVAAMCAFMFYSLKWRDALKVQRVIVGGSRILRAQDVLALAGVPTNTPMSGVNLFDVQTRVRHQPFIKSVLVSRQMPDAIRIDLEERQPIASVNFGQVQYVDAEGVLLPADQTLGRFDLPMISGIRNIKGLTPGKAVESDQLVTAINVLQAALAIDSTVYHLISEVKINDDEIVLYAADGGVPINLGKGDIARKLETLQSFWTKYVKPGDAEKLRYIDLRFEGQVVVKWNHDAENRSTKYSL
jgi:cell division septal protein FtsQ